MSSTRPGIEVPGARHRGRAALALCLALGLGFGLAGSAGARGPGHHGRDRLAHLERRIEGMQLDDETRSAILAVIDEARQEQRSLREEMREGHEAMRQLLQQDAPDTEAVEAQVEALGALETEAHKRGIATFLRVRAMLPEDQRDALAFRGKHFRSRDER